MLNNYLSFQSDMPATFLYPIIFLPTADLSQTRHFYENILKLPLALDQGACLIFRVGKYGYWGFCKQSEEGILNPEKVCLTLVVETRTEVDEWHNYLAKENVNVKRPPQYTAAYKIYNGFYLDPLGYTIEIQAFDTDGEPAGAELFKE
ncbi:MAG: VOC family protein [Promethearchaeota archaeon]